MSQTIIENVVKQVGLMNYTSLGNLNNPYYTVTDTQLKQIIKVVVEECVNICEENGAVNSAAQISARFF